MKCKTLLAMATIAASSAALATVTSLNTLCRIAVTNDMAETLISVPLVEVGGSVEQIPLTNYVLTTNLAGNDKLLQWNGTKYYAWNLNGTTWEWEPLTVVDGNAAWQTPSGDVAKLARGTGAWLVRGESSKSKEFYLYGQVSGAEVVSTFIGGQQTLMGHPRAAAFNPNSGVTWSGQQDGDMIIFANPANRTGMTKLTYKADKVNGWARQTEPGVWTKDETSMIPAGQGFWYVSKGSANGTATWGAQ
jgi:hypothetical protein